jgi:putative cardiolipin synthase
MHPSLRILFFAFCGLSACAQLPPRTELVEEFALRADQDSPLDRALLTAEAQHSRQSAFRLVVEGTEAFVLRVQSARMAQRSLDVQTYIWHADLTGMYFAHELIAAADRGVRVRLLLDDMDARAKNAGLAALAAHPNIHVRLFNPFASRGGTLAFLGEGIRSFSRLNRRMHNKSWIADNRIAIVGGRNVGDEYFGASDAVNFVDLDFAMVGPVVRDASTSFDKYWNSPSSYPMELLDADSITQPALDKLRNSLATHSEQSEGTRYGISLRSNDSIKRMVEGDWPLEWTQKYRFISDDPLKVTMTSYDSQRSEVGAALVPFARSAQTDLTIVSPYFVPGKSGSELLIQSAQAGKRVRVMTNSLAANDVAAVHGGYSRYRKSLLKGGVQLWELKPLGDYDAHTSLFGSSGASLHTKALSVDGNTLFVGSYNVDPRSTWLNCEQGVLVESPALATQLEALVARGIEGKHAWHVTLEDDALAWTDGDKRFDSDPDASLGRRFQAWLARVLRLEAQL